MSVKLKPASLLEGLDLEGQYPVLPVVYVCMSHTLTDLQVADLHARFGVLVSFCHDGETDTALEEKQVSIVLASPALKAKTSAISGLATLAEVQELAKEMVAEAIEAGASYFVCMGEPTLAMWANIYAGGEALSLGSYCDCGASYPQCGCAIGGTMTCLASTTERSSVDTPQPDGSIKTVATFKHCAWRAIF